jgi:hypothetical protein
VRGVGAAAAAASLPVAAGRSLQGQRVDVAHHRVHLLLSLKMKARYRRSSIWPREVCIS